MEHLRYVAIGALSLMLVSAPFAFADTPSLSVQAVLPGTSVVADSKIIFTLVTSGFTQPSYQLTDSFSGSTASVNDISGAGNFSWVPVASDVGTHTLSITANDFSGNTATVTQTITVEPPPSVSVTAVSPGPAIMPGTPFTFSVSTFGFTDPSYIVSDSFPQTTVNDSDMSASGNFSWTPADVSQDGDHTINVYAYDSLGQSASVDVPVRVGPGPSLTIQSLSPGTSISPSQGLSFIANGSNFSPDTFSIGDSFPNTTLTNSNINSAGSFYWVPQPSDIGKHVITITGTIGVYGQSATTTQTITVLGTPAAVPVSASSSGFTFTTSLYSGMQGAAVTELQTLLSQQGFFSETPNGSFGPVTTAAVEHFQAAHDLPQLGVVGPATRAVLNSLLSASSAPSTATTSTVATSSYSFENPVSFGESGADVLQLQKRLSALGFFSGQPTGYFGDATLEALIQFQEAKDIPMVDQLGSATRAALNQ